MGEILGILLLIIANGVFAMAEIALVSARKTRLAQQANEGNAKARLALAFANAPREFLSTVQLGITLIGILAGALGETTLAQPLAASLRQVPWLGAYSEALSLGFVVCSIAYCSLVIGELVPKQLALHNPERIAAALVAPMRVITRLAAPAVWLLSASTAAILHVLGGRPAPEPPVTEAEIKVLLQQGVQAGVFAAAEHEMVHAVFRFGDRRAGALMTPRTAIVWLDVNDSPQDTGRRLTESAHARFPVGQGSLDQVVGVVHAKDVLAQSLAGQPVDLTRALRPPVFVPEHMPALHVLELFKRTGLPLALVVDEHGGVEGLITLTDMLEALVGDLPAEEGVPAEPLAMQRDDGSWLVDGMLPIDTFKDLFHITHLPGEDAGAYHTVGGFIMMHLERIPAPAEHFDWDGFSFEVLDMDGQRVDKVLVVPRQTRRTCVHTPYPNTEA